MDTIISHQEQKRHWGSPVLHSTVSCYKLYLTPSIYKTKKTWNEHLFFGSISYSYFQCSWREWNPGLLFVCLFIESILQCHPHSGFLSGFLDNFTCPPAYMPPVFPAALPAVALSAFPWQWWEDKTLREFSPFTGNFSFLPASASSNKT